MFAEDGVGVWEVGDMTTEVIDAEIRKLLQVRFAQTRTGAVWELQRHLFVLSYTMQR